MLRLASNLQKKLTTRSSYMALACMSFRALSSSNIFVVLSSNSHCLSAASTKSFSVLSLSLCIAACNTTHMTICNH